MKLYKVKQGTNGSVYPPGKKAKPKHNFSVTKDVTFQDYEKIFDPVALHNNGLKDVSKWCRMMASKGYAGFRRDNYLLVVRYAKVDVMC